MSFFSAIQEKKKTLDERLKEYLAKYGQNALDSFNTVQDSVAKAKDTVDQRMNDFKQTFSEDYNTLQTQADAVTEKAKMSVNERYKQWQSEHINTDAAKQKFAQLGDLRSKASDMLTGQNDQTRQEDIVKREELKAKQTFLEDQFKSGRIDEKTYKKEFVALQTSDPGLQRNLVNMAGFLGSGGSNIVKSGSSEIEKYIAQETAKQTTARGGAVQGVKGTLGDIYKTIKSKLIDSNAPIEDLLATAQKKGKFEVLPKFDISNQIDRVLRAPTIAGQFARENGLEGVIKAHKTDLEALDQYLIAKHAQTLAAQGIKTGRNAEMDAKLIQELGPQFEGAAQQVHAYSQKLLDYSVKSGLIPEELAVKLKAIYPDYVPMNRIFSELEKSTTGFGTKAVASLSKQSVVQKIVGSERAIESPIQSLLQKTNDAFTQGEKNIAADILTGYKDLPGNPFGLRELKSGETAAHTISFLDKGVKRTYETLPEIADAAKSLGVQQINILGKIFALPVRVAKVGITGINLPFVGANIARDQVYSFITAKNGIKTSVLNPVNFTQALFNAIGHGKLYQEMVREGAGGTSFDIARNQIPKTVAEIRGLSAPGAGAKIKYVVSTPARLFRAVENIVGRSEELTRLQQYGGTKSALLSSGRTTEDATILAAKAARENTANFARRGEWGTVLNSAFLYLNAGIQGSRSFIRAAERDPVKTTAKVATSLFLPVSMATAWNLRNEDTRKVYEDIPDYEKQNKLIIIPPNPTQDASGKWNVIALPLPPGVGSLASIPRRAIEQAHGMDPVKFGEVAASLLSSLSPVNVSSTTPENINNVASTFTPQAIKPGLEALTNRTFFTGNPIVSKKYQDLPPDMQVKPGTTGTATLLGKVLGVSPIKIDAFLKETLGGIAPQLLNASDNVLAKTGKIAPDQIGGQSTIDAIVSRFSKVQGGEADNKVYDQLDAIIEQQKGDSFKLKQEATDVYNKLKDLPKDEANAEAAKLKEQNPQLFEKLKDVAQEAKLSPREKVIMQLGVANGERAKYILEQADKLKSKEEKNAYINDLIKKKVVSDQVLKQIEYYINHR